MLKTSETFDPDKPFNKPLLRKIIIYFLAQLFSFFLIGKVTTLLNPKVYPEIIFLLQNLVSLSLLIIIFNLYIKKTFAKLNHKRFNFKIILIIIPIVILISLIATAVSGLIFNSVNQTSAFNEQTKYLSLGTGNTWSQYIISLITIVFLVPIIEELFARGILLNSFKAKLGIIPGLVISSCLFALGHVYPVLIINTFVLGLFLGWIYLKTKNIFYPISAHIILNSLPFLVPLIAYDWARFFKSLSS